MIGIVIFGLITTVLGLWMIVKPKLWLDLSVRYCRLTYMHPLEILLRLGFGFIFVIYSADTRFPSLILYAGYLLIAVGVGLAFLRPSFHRRIGITMIQRIGPWFRLTGLVVLPIEYISDLRGHLSALTVPFSQSATTIPSPPGSHP